jgi:hypothetical protein
MTVTGWWKRPYYGDYHLIPMGDERMHTIPMCWCPIRIHRKPGHIAGRLHEHFSVEEIQEGKHTRRGILK